MIRRPTRSTRTDTLFPYTTLFRSVAARVLGTPEKPLMSEFQREIDEGWSVWKTQRGLQGFPDSALTDPDTFKAYLRSEEHTSELQSLMRISYAVFCLKKKKPQPKI